MKQNILFKMLPMMAAAVLFAASCSKDSDGDSNVVPTLDNNVPEQEQVENLQPRTVPFTVMVSKDDSSLSKSSVERDGENLVQKFIAGDELVITGGSGENTISGTLSLAEGDEGKTSDATFSGELTLNGTAELVVGTTLTATLHNTESATKNDGIPVSSIEPTTSLIKRASSLHEAFEKYGYLTAENFTYNGDETQISLVQHTRFIAVDLPFSGAKITVKVNDDTEQTFYLSKECALAFPADATVTVNSTTLGISDYAISKAVTWIRSTDAKPRETPKDCIPGLFSVGSDKQVFFSKGNLQYNVNDSKFLLADNQWDYVGGMWNGKYYGTLSGNDNSNAQGPLVDLFGWGMWLDEITTKESILKNTQNSSDYTPAVSDGQFADNKTTIEGTAWFTMSNAEWEYLFDTRENHSLYGKGTVNGVSGLIVLPDKWIQPDGVSSLVTGGTSTKYSSNNYSDQAWKKMEDNGALFLPAARRRYGSGFDAEYNLAHYWTSSASSENSNYAGFLYFIDDGNINKFEVTYWNRYRGHSVRLARGLK